MLTLLPLFTFALLSESCIPEVSPIDPPAAAIERFARRGTTILEADAGTDSLPPLPRHEDGTVDRDRIVQTLREEMFGTVPPLQVTSAIAPPQPVEVGPPGSTVRVVTLTINGDVAASQCDLLLFEPPGDGPHDCFVFLDHRSVTADSDAARQAIVDGRLNANHDDDYWDVPRILGAGFATIAVPVLPIAPDVRSRDFNDGIHALVSGPRDPNWSALAAWAWGMSQARAAIASDPSIGRCLAIGHSRGGKTALWAAASDAEFAGAVSNNSGCGGAAVSRRRIGETVAVINRTFPHWFNTQFQTYNDRESVLPHDQHWLLAAIAPRPLAIGSAGSDYWADPVGEWVSLCEASPAWADIELGTMPAVGEVRSSGPLQYHLRPGEHGLTAADWDRYFDWATRTGD